MNPAKRGIALALLGAGALLVQGCGRSALLAKRGEAGGRDANRDGSDLAGPRPDAEAGLPDTVLRTDATLRDLGAPRLDGLDGLDADVRSPDRGEVRDATVREIADSGRSDGNERRDVARRDAGADVVTHTDTIPACFPPIASSCVPGPSNPTSLAVLDGMGSIFGIEAFGSRLMAGGALDLPIGETPKGRMVSIEVATAGVTKLDLAEGVPKIILGAGPALVYTPGLPQQTRSGDWQFDYTKVVRWDLQTDDRTELPTPAGATSSPVFHLAGNIKGEVFWSSAGRDQPGIAKWDPCTQATTWLTAVPSIGPLMAGASEVYWLGWDEDGHGEIWSIPSAGGIASVLYRSLNAVPILGGVDDTLLYFGDAEAGIMAMPKEGGTGQVVVEDAMNYLLRLDQIHLYWIEPLSGDTIRRATKSDGRAEVFWSGTGRWVQAMAVDDCNVYWVVANPFEVFYRRK